MHQCDDISDLLLFVFENIDNPREYAFPLHHLNRDGDSCVLVIPLIRKIN